MSTHILVFDHSAVLLATFEHQIEAAGYKVTPRFPREINKREIAKHSPDIILLALPETGGSDALGRMIALHDDPELVHLPVVVATPSGQRLHVDSLPVGITHVDFMLTPFDIQDVLAEIRRIEHDST